MSKIEANVKVNGNELNELRRKETEKKQIELKKIDEEAKRQEASIRASSESTKLEVRNASEKQVLDTIEEKEKRLTEMKKSLEETGSIIENEKMSSIKNAENLREERQVQNTSRMDEMTARHRNDVVVANDKLAGELADLNQKATQAENMARYKGRVEADKIRRTNDAVIGIEEKTFQDKLFNQDIKQNLALESQRDVFNNTFATNESTHNQKFMTQQIRHNHAQETALKQNEMTVNQSKSDFEQKYQNLLGEQHLMLKNLEDRVASQTEKLKNEQSKNKELIDNRSMDEFYRGVTITPIIQDTPTAYKVKIPLAPHEAANANLSGKDRNLKFVFSRNSENNITLPDGTSNKTKKAESVVKEFSVAEIINDRKIEKSYVDGVVVFNVPKK